MSIKDISVLLYSASIHLVLGGIASLLAPYMAIEGDPYSASIGATIIYFLLALPVGITIFGAVNSEL